ncbi:hypothetical protein A6770_32775 [Nostoc minutum NIES-26]|uniref:non-specific serine/threonine protein kinase n=1 Tax=Nostoc minutum NIES-26 TaxID=1844469 RepID=A0A367Q391_9NOSO|nr:hypothetical protein A6770_32775 [Nostoc minutum NIES-26]
MQKIEGENLREWVKSYGRISQSLAIDWFHQLIDILDLIHRSGFFHRDIKPENIIHQPDGKLVLVDFGAAQRITRTYLTKISTSGGTSTGLGSGHEITSIVTPLFTPLEQIEGQAVPQSDFYALGRTFVNLVTNISLIDIPKNEDRSRLIWRKYAPQIDKPFADLLDDMMSPAPGQRPQSTKIILQRLERLPLKLKFNRVVRSKIFLLSLAIFGLIVSISCFEGIKLVISNYYFNIASRHRNEPKIARENYELAIKFNPKDVDAYNNLALACQLLADTKCMNESYERAFKLKPDNWVSHYNLGNFYDDQGKYEQAEQQYKLAIQYSNNQAMNALSNLARLKNRQEKYPQAAELAIQGLSRTQNREWQAGLYKNLGWARFKQQRYAEAEEYLQKSVKLDSQRVDAYCLLAQTYEALRNLSKAEIYWEVCLVANSGLPEVQEWRQQVLQRIFKEN